MTTNSTTASGTSARKRRQVITDEVSSSRAMFSTMAFSWQQVDWSQRAGWTTLGKLIGQRNGTRPLSGYQAFVMLNSVNLMLSGSDGIVLDAPASYLPPTPLPSGLTVTATFGGSPDPIFTLQVNSSGYDGPVEVHALNPIAETHDQSADIQLTKIALLTSLPAGAASLSASYQDAFPNIAPGAKVVLQLTPIHPAGFRGKPLQKSAVAVHLLEQGEKDEPQPDNAPAAPAPAPVKTPASSGPLRVG